MTVGDDDVGSDLGRRCSGRNGPSIGGSTVSTESSDLDQIFLENRRKLLIAIDLLGFSEKGSALILVLDRPRNSARSAAGTAAFQRPNSVDWALSLRACDLGLSEKGVPPLLKSGFSAVVPGLADIRQQEGRPRPPGRGGADKVLNCQRPRKLKSLQVEYSTDSHC